MQATRRLFLVAIALLMPASSGFALEELVVVPQADEATRRKTRQQYLNELIDSIHKTCNLNEWELRRLQVASKGAVEYSFGEERQQRRQRQQMQVIKWGLVAEPGGVNAIDASAAARHAIWTTTIERMLSGERLQAAKSLAEQQLAEYQQRDPRIRRFINVGFGRNGKLRQGDVRLPAQMLKEIRVQEEAPILQRRRGG